MEPTSPFRDTSVVGASGSVMGLLIAYAMVNPDRQFFLFPLPVPVNARALVLIAVIFNLMMAMNGGGGISVATHFGGMAAGYGFMKLLPYWGRVRFTRGGKRQPKDPMAAMGDAVDNVFKFDEEKRRRK